METGQWGALVEGGGRGRQHRLLEVQTESMRGRSAIPGSGAERGRISQGFRATGDSLSFEV
jgi:hypothetical protein